MAFSNIDVKYLNSVAYNIEPNQYITIFAYLIRLKLKVNPLLCNVI